MPPHPVDVAVALFAQRQAGAFSVAQAKLAGADDALIWRRRRADRWLHPAPGVLSLPGFPEDAWFRLWVAALDAGPSAMASHGTGAALFGVDGYRIEPMSLVVAHGGHHQNALATVHQTRRLPTPVLVRGVPTTPIARVVLDLAATTRPVALGRVIDQSVASLGARLDDIRLGADWMHRTHRQGAVNLNRALEGRTHGYVPTRSELERLLDAVLSTLGDPQPEREVHLASHPLEPHRVDRLFRSPPLVVEGDGRLWHARLSTMDQDRRRDRRALRLGFPTVRYGWHELAHEAADVQAELLQILGRSRSGAHSPWSTRSA